jgi:hypothetical protein
MSRRRANASPMSLFSFQDIITATTGILILLALVLAISLITQGAPSVIETPAATDDRLNYRLALIAEIESMRNQSTEIGDLAASLTSATPDEIRRKSAQAAESIKQLKLDVANARTTLTTLEDQKKELEQEADRSALKAKLDKLNEEIEQTNLKLKEITAENRVVYNFRNTNRTPWLVEIKGASIQAAKAGVASTPNSFRSASEFNRFAMGLPDSERYFVLLIAPSGISKSEQIRDFLAEKNVDLGMDLIGENQQVLDPVKGGGY